MEALPYLDNAFKLRDLPFGLMFPEDKVAAAGEVQRVLAGRRVGYMVGTLVVTFFVIRRAIARLLAKKRDRCRIDTTWACRSAYAILKTAGLEQVEEHEPLSARSTISMITSTAPDTRLFESRSKHCPAANGKTGGNATRAAPYLENDRVYMPIRPASGSAGKTERS